MYLKRGLGNTLLAVKKNKLWLGGIIILQLVFIVSFFYLALDYQAKIFNEVEKVAVPLNEMDLDQENLLQNEEARQKMLEVKQSFDSIKNKLREFALFSLILFLGLNGLVWVLTHGLWEEKKKFFRSALQRSGKIITLTLLALGVFALLSFLIIKLSSQRIALENFPLIGKIEVILFLVIYYFLLVSFAFVDLPWKEIGKSFLAAGFKKAHKSLLVLLINVILIAFLSYLIFYSLSSTPFFWLGISLILILGMILVLIKIFWIACLREVAYEKNPH